MTMETVRPVVELLWLSYNLSCSVVLFNRGGIAQGLSWHYLDSVQKDTRRVAPGPCTEWNPTVSSANRNKLGENQALASSFTIHE